ncbi:short-chain dehydrogenases/reductases (SDR) family protein [Abortiporus biennis]
MEAHPIYDALDIDLVVKVLNHTAFSPFFTCMIPIFYYFQGARWPDTILVVTLAYTIGVSAFWFLKWYSRLFRNQGSLLFGPPRFDWGDQIVVITGGSSGIGELIANTLAVRNVCVVVLDVNPIVTENYNITYYKCDVSKWEEVEATAKTIVEELGHPTVLINNAGVVQGKRILDLTPADIQQTFSVNTLAHFWTLKAFLPEMIKQNAGHIINISSVAGMVGMAQLTDYCASKAALISLHESLRYELDHQYKAKSFSFAVISALDEQHSQIIYLPFYANFVPFLAIMPSFVRDFGQWLSGCDYSMEKFVKVSGRRPEEGPAPKTNSIEEERAKDD